MRRTTPLRTLAIAVAVATLLATGCEWRFETLDGNGGSNGATMNDVGTHNAAVLYNGRPHVFYFDDTDDTLRHAYYNGQFWAFETLDGNGGPNGRVIGPVGEWNTAVLYNERPHVFYHAGAGDLRHAYYNGVAWVFETLDGITGSHGQTGASVGRFNAATVYNGRPHVFYRNYGEATLRHAYYNGLYWAFETLDGHQNGPHGQTMNSVGNSNAATLYNGRPHVYYRDEDAETLRHAYYNGQFWAFETLDGVGGSNGRTNASVGTDNAVMLYNGRPHVFYLGLEPTYRLRHAYYTGSAWEFETLDGMGGRRGHTNNDVGSHNAAILYKGRPHVYYRDVDADALRHAYWNGYAWAFEVLDGNGGPNGATNNMVGEDNAVMLYNGRPDVFYYDTTDDALRHGWLG